ncbi:MAG: YkvA family protein [Actinomadura sp.]
MVWPGVLVLFTGAILTFALDRRLGPVDAGTVGVITMVLGGALLITGLVRLNRRRPGTRLPTYRDAGRERIYQTGRGKIFAMVTAVLYILSPIDIVPDFLLPVGVIDDATAFSWLLFAVGQEMTRHSRKRKALSGRDGSAGHG